ncbi:hypothetical protein PSV09DRAFT_2423315 [Bipolaris maydis]|uniref:uncharacterized protein n=1 Tax=Cochliobolus heterostrophus TaxID=5016 RepID=UPI0024D9255F|nr:hypothetical protein J3E73DRAFT_412678 [Bipolaris maydis]KAJ5056687.1 hypothetical protein J3E74DRAFT_440353 [Bipolaris maydis]KAJ6208376.1 hypothetical protein PSV09DRAFT_2423315 [Bipolaris maydis]KAJ6270361.1 hypothetical protein PSV08DRAFT_391732 [Bipolaris maydis]KAJ6283986.1 hypothetical protein J3E71DRAFT_377464 [Bipolaris maydis]
MFRLLSAIFALLIALAQAKHEGLRLYAFTSADCNGPPIYGNIDFKRDKCTSVAFGASSIKIVEKKKGDWTKEINSGPTGCYFYAYTQFGCLERYLDTLVDPGDVISSCIPSRDANAPIMSVSFMCIRGAPPKRSLPPRSVNWTHDTSDPVQYISSRPLKWHTPIFVNQTAGLNETGRSGDNLTTRHRVSSFFLPPPGFNLTSQSNSTPEVKRGNLTTLHYGPHFPNKQPDFNLTAKIGNGNMTARHHGPAFINGQPNFNNGKPKTTEGNLTVRHYGPAIVDGKLNSRSTPGSNKETSWNETQPAVEQTAEQDVAVASKTIALESVVFNPTAFKTVIIEPAMEGRAVAEPVANKTTVHNSTEFNDSDNDSDSDSDSDDDDLPAGNSTTPNKRAIVWQGPTRGVWMLHPWTGSIICYECYARTEKWLSYFECRAGPMNPADCGERPLAPVYTKTVSIQPVVTVIPNDSGPLVKRSWHRPVYMHNPWYPGMTVCATAKWQGRGKKLDQGIKIKHPKAKLRKCEKSPDAQNIAIYIRTATTTEPVRTVSLVDVRDLDSPRPVPATSTSSSSSSSSALPTTVVATNVPVVVMSSVTVVQSASSSSSETSSSPSLSILKFTIPTSTSTAMATKTLVVSTEPEAKPTLATVMEQKYKTIVILPEQDG